jgi:hypothetical protein
MFYRMCSSAVSPDLARSCLESSKSTGGPEPFKEPVRRILDALVPLLQAIYCPQNDCFAVSKNALSLATGERMTLLTSDHVPLVHMFPGPMADRDTFGLTCRHRHMYMPGTYRHHLFVLDKE